MNPHKNIPEPEPEPIMPWEQEGAWTQSQRKRAKTDLYALADELDQGGATEDEVCAFLATFGQQIGSGSYTNWSTRAYQWGASRAISNKHLDNGGHRR